MIKPVAAALLLGSLAVVATPLRDQDVGKLHAEVKALARAEEDLRAEVVRLETTLWVKREALIDAIVRRRLAEARLVAKTP